MPSSRRTPRRRKRLRADMESAPTTNGGPAAKRANRGPAVISGLCRGRCLHCARRRVSEANRATGPALRPEIVPRGLWRCKVPREGHGPPLQTMANTGPNGKGTRPPGGRRAGCPHPAAPRGGAGPRFLKFPRCGGRERPPYGPGQHGGPPGNRRSCAVTNPCRGGFHIRPVRGGARSCGRAWPSRTNHGEHPAKWRRPRPLLSQRPGTAPFYGVVVTGNVKTVIRRPAALRGPARRCGS